MQKSRRASAQGCTIYILPTFQMPSKVRRVPLLSQSWKAHEAYSISTGRDVYSICAGALRLMGVPSNGLRTLVADMRESSLSHAEEVASAEGGSYSAIFREVSYGIMRKVTHG